MPHFLERTKFWNAPISPFSPNSGMPLWSIYFNFKFGNAISGTPLTLERPKFWNVPNSGMILFLERSNSGMPLSANSGMPHLASIWEIHSHLECPYLNSGMPPSLFLERPPPNFTRIWNASTLLAFGMPLFTRIWNALPYFWNAPNSIFGTPLYLNMEYSLAFGMPLP